MRRPKALYMLADYARKLVYGAEIGDELGQLCDFYAPPQTAESVAENPEQLAEAEVIFSGWHAPRLDRDLLKHAPNLKIVFYGGGTLRSLVSEEFWSKGIRVTNAVQANAIPVAQYTLSQILFGLKLGWQHNQLCKNNSDMVLDTPGTYGSTVGLVSMGNIARNVRKMLPEDLHVLTHDPYLEETAAQQLKVERVSLHELFERSHVISLHTPDLPQTHHMIRKEHFQLMRPYALFINTARQAVVQHDDLVTVLGERPDLWAVLDHFEGLPRTIDAKLRELPNVTLTPHIAGSTGLECRRMGRYMIDELKRYVSNQPLLYEVLPETYAVMA